MAIKQIGQLLTPPTVASKKELQQLESKDLKIGSEEYFLNTSLDLEKPIAKDPTHLKEALRYAMALVGMRAENMPAEEEKELLLQFLVTQFGGHTAGEIKLAFTMAVKGELTDYGLDPREVKPYENFSILYVANILKCYREWARQVVPTLPVTRRKVLAELPPVDTSVTDEGFIEAVRISYTKGGKNFMIIPVLAYKVLEPKIGLTKEEEKEIRQAVNYMFPNADKPLRRDLRRQMAVGLYFDKQIKAEQNGLQTRSEAATTNETPVPEL